MQEYAFLEFFAGRASVTQAMRHAGSKPAKFDLDYDQKPAERNKEC